MVTPDAPVVSLHASEQLDSIPANSINNNQQSPVVPQQNIDRDRQVKQILDANQRAVSAAQYFGPRMPKNYFNLNGTFDYNNGAIFRSQWWNDAVGTYLTKLNETQADDFAGRIVVANERLNRVRNADKYIRAAKKVQ